MEKETKCKGCGFHIPSQQIDEDGYFSCVCGEIGNIDGKSAVECTLCLNCKGTGKFDFSQEFDDSDIRNCIECKGLGNPKEAFPERFEDEEI